MVNAFSSHLNLDLERLALPSNILDQMRANEIKLAGLQLPAGLDPDMRIAVSKSIGDAFVFGFRIIMLICVALSVASSAIAWLMIPRDSRGILGSLPSAQVDSKGIDGEQSGI
jgi:hypothetical protein